MSLEILKIPAERREAWETVSGFLFDDWLKAPWKRVRWKALKMAIEFSEMDDPPSGWPDDRLPNSWPGW